MAQPQKDQSILRYGTGALAAMGACVISNPVEVMKTRMQLQGELRAKGQFVTSYRNVFHAFKVVFENEGVRGVQKGLVLGLVYQAAMNGTRLGMYDYVKSWHAETFNRKMNLAEEIGSASIAGAVGSVCGSPFYLVKTQQQSQSSAAIKVGYQHEHRSIAQAFSHIYKQSGVPGLFRGAAGAVPRLMVGSAVQLTTYAHAKRIAKDMFDLEEGVTLHLAGSMLAGLCVSYAMNPFDLIATRLYNQPVDPQNPTKGLYYSGWWDCAKKLIKTEGFAGCYKGVTALYLRLGPHTVAMFVLWEKLKQLTEKT